MNEIEQIDAVSESPDSLDWLAARYVLDELTAADRDAFEERLADDQAARDAVVQATELVVAVAEFGRPAIGSHRSVRRLSRVGALAALSVLATTAALVAVLVLPTDPQSDDLARRSPEPSESSDAEDVDDVVALWSISRVHEMVGESDVASADLADSELIGGRGSYDLNASGNSLEPPTWMMAAVSLESEPTPETPSLPEDVFPSDTETF